MKRLAKAFGVDVLANVHKLIGSADYMLGRNVIQTTLVHDKSGGRLKDLQVIKIRPDGPKHPGDWFILNFFRAYCSGIITSV